MTRDVLAFTRCCVRLQPG